MIMFNTSRIPVVAALMMSLSAAGVEVGPETPVIESTQVATQQNVVISRDSTRTLIAFEETAGEGQLSRVVLHQYEARLGVLLGRETFGVDPSTHHQRRPALGRNMIAWVEEDPNGTGASLWWQGLGGYLIGSNFAPDGTRAERVADVAPGTRIQVFNTHVFHVILWTAPDGRLKAVLRSLIARIGYDPSPFYVTAEAALNPSTGDPWGTPLIAYNVPESSEACEGPCSPRFSIRAKSFEGASAIDIALAGASAPRVVFNGTDYVVFWSMEEGGTYAQRVSVAGGLAVKIGEVRKVHDGSIHDASPGPNEEYFLAVQRGLRFAFLRLDDDLEVIQEVTFAARLAGGATVSLSSNPAMRAMLAYGAQRPSEGAQQAVFRLVDDNVGVRKRRSVR